MKNPSDTIYVFYHMPKCGGTTIAYHIKKNFKKDQQLSLYLEDITETPYKNLSFEEIDQRVIKKVKKLSKDRRKNIRIIYGHLASYEIHKYFERKPFYFTIFRDPVSRTISNYNFWCQSYFYYNENIYFNQTNVKELLKKGCIPDLDNWLSGFYNKGETSIPKSSMAYLLKRSNYLDRSNKLSEKVIQNSLNKFDFIGLLKTFDYDSSYIYHRLGINKFYDNQNVSIKYFKKKYMDKRRWKILKRKILKINKVDTKLYKYAEKLNNTYKKENKNFYSSVKKLKRRKRITYPFTRRVPMLKNFTKIFIYE